MKMKDLPPVDRPREKLFRYRSVHRITTIELLAIILGTGTKGENVLKLATRIVAKLEQLNEQPQLSTFFNMKGVGRTKASQIVAAIELGKRLQTPVPTLDILKPSDVWSDMSPTYTTKKEHFYAYYLDTRNTVIKKELISIGSLNASIVHPREVFEPAVRHLSAHIILSHNHPSGDQTPSDADILVTRKLAEAGKILDIEVLDHVVVSQRGFTSMKQNKLF